MRKIKLLVTGGSGFIGSNFILFVLKNFKNYSVTNIDAEFHGSNKKNLQSLKNNRNYEYVKGNIKNHKLVEKLVKKSDVVVNFAAESHVDRSIQHPKTFFDSNIMGVYFILESIKKFNKKFIQISTDEVYGSLMKGSADEKFTLNPSSPYAASKASAEMLVRSYNATFATNTIITRCTNNFGPRQFPEKLIPKTIILALKNKKIPIYGSGKNIRDWLYVYDHCDAIMQVIKKGKVGESYNISGHNEVNNNKIVKTILELMNKSTDFIKYVEDRPGHDFRYSLDSTKIEKQLKWKPHFSLEEGLTKTVSWYQKNEKWWKNIGIKKFGRLN